MKNFINSTCIVVLGDGDTYDGEESTTVYFLNQEGTEQLVDGGGFNNVSDNNVIHSVRVTDLIDCWIKNNLK